MDNTFQSPAIISFCPGILGLERGLARAIGKLRVVAYVEIEAFIIANLVAGMEAGVLDPAPIWTDAKTFDARPFRGRIHGIIGGYPCTPFSTAGNRTGENHSDAFAAGINYRQGEDMYWEGGFENGNADKETFINQLFKVK